MNVNVSAWSIRRPVPGLVLFLVLIVLGCLSFQSLRTATPQQPVLGVQLFRSRPCHLVRWSLRLLLIGG